jgi:hypothetical protein
MTPLHTDDDQIRRLDEMVRAIYDQLIAANTERTDRAAKTHHLQRMQSHARRLIAELTPPNQPASESQNRLFDLGD